MHWLLGRYPADLSCGFEEGVARGEGQELPQAQGAFLDADVRAGFCAVLPHDPQVEAWPGVGRPDQGIQAGSQASDCAVVMPCPPVGLSRRGPTF
eukprot:UN2003